MPDAARAMADLCKVFICNSLLFVIENGLTPIAWSDHEGRLTLHFCLIPFNDANAPIWCVLLPYKCDFLVFFPFFG
jgi:hypothetical protein